VPSPAASAAAAAAGAEAEDALQEQVLVAAFPDAPPEVHVASLDTRAGSLTLREASVLGRGEVSMGRKRTIELADVGSVDSQDGVVALLGLDSSILVQLHMESFEDQQTWANAIRTLLGGRGARRLSGGREGDEDDVCMLQARSQQLQNRIGTLEALGKRRDLHMQKMQKRVDGSMRMLAAVKDMCAQQRRALEAQKVAIMELRRELGDSPEGNEADRSSAVERPVETEPEAEAPAYASGEAGGGAEAVARDEAVAEAQEEIAAKTKQMLELLHQADEMQRALHQLQALQAETEAASTGPPQPSPTTARAVAPPQEALGKASTAPGTSAAALADGARKEVDDGDSEVVLSRLQQLQAEKERYEGMVRDSQQEHEDLLQRLSEMRSLMTALGIQDDGGDPGGD